MIECLIRPYAFKKAICGANSIFNGNYQHDAMEFFLFLLEKFSNLRIKNIRDYFEINVIKFEKKINLKDSLFNIYI